MKGKGWESWGGGKIEKITYIVSLLAIGVVESAGLAVAAPLAVLPVVPRGGGVAARGQRRAGGLLSVRLVFGVGPGKGTQHTVRKSRYKCGAKWRAKVRFCLTSNAPECQEESSSPF